MVPPQESSLDAPMAKICESLGSVGTILATCYCHAGLLNLETPLSENSVKIPGGDLVDAQGQGRGGGRMEW